MQSILQFASKYVALFQILMHKSVQVKGSKNLMRRNVFLFLSSILMLVFLAGCSGAKSTQGVGITDIKITTEPNSSSTQVAPTRKPTIPSLEPYKFKKSDAGKITLHGILAVIDPITILPASDDAIYLVPLDGESSGAMTIPQFTPGDVPQADVDERTGEFVFTNIEPGRYAVVVITQGGSQMPARKFDDKTLAIYNFDTSSQGKMVELGTLRLP